jgi:hypothetical protein
MTEGLSLGFIIGFGVVFATLAAACAYVISLHEYRQRMLRLDQSAPRLAAQTAVTTFVCVAIAAVVLGWMLGSRGI